MRPTCWICFRPTAARNKDLKSAVKDALGERWAGRTIMAFPPLRSVKRRRIGTPDRRAIGTPSFILTDSEGSFVPLLEEGGMSKG
jgi:hypothetical protein